ncbi:MAG: CBS domain-containing protein [Acidobacteriota bacterium]|nr:CBS domain-containing protein [Acidobacteriota bacterium]
MLSKLRHFRVVDAKGRQHPLSDLAIALLESDYPEVTHLFCKNSGHQQLILPWSTVKGIDWRRGEIQIETFDIGVPATADFEEVLLRRDIVDGLVLDLHNRRATRANDLWLEYRDGQLLLKAADTTSWAVLRRLSLGYFGSKPSRAPYDWKYIEFLRGDPHAVKNGAGYNMRIKRLPPGEIAGLCCFLPYLHVAELLTLLPDPIAADTLEAMGHDRQVQVFGELSDEQALRLLGIMAAHDAVDLLGRLPPEMTNSFLERLPKDRSDQLVELLRYPEDTVGGIMTNDVVSLRFDSSVGEARLALRHRVRQADFTHFIYAVESDETRVLRGAVSLQDLLVTDDERPLEQIMNPYVTALNPLESAETGAYRVLNSHLAALPVVGQEKQLLGIVTVDAAVMQVAPENWSTQAPKVFS